MFKLITKNDLKNQLSQMGIKPTDTVLIHISLKALGEVDGGADAVIDAFCEYLSEGMFIVPTHTWDSVTKDNPVFDVRTAVPCIGTLPRIAAKRSDGVRTLHPTHSMWIHGSNAEVYAEGEENAGSPGAKGFCWDRLADVGAKILLIGVKHDRDTFIHSIDEHVELPNRLGESFEVTITDSKGQQLKRLFRSHHCSRTYDVSQYYVNFEKPLVELGAQKFGTLGNAEVGIVDAKMTRDIISGIYSHADESFFTQFTEIPEEWYR